MEPKSGFGWASRNVEPNPVYARALPLDDLVGAAFIPESRAPAAMILRINDPLVVILVVGKL